MITEFFAGSIILCLIIFILATLFMILTACVWWILLLPFRIVWLVIASLIKLTFMVAMLPFKILAP